MTDLTAMRAKFETEMRKIYGAEHFEMYDEAIEGRIYKSASMNGAWRGFQAAWNARPAAQVSEAVAWWNTKYDSVMLMKRMSPQLGGIVGIKSSPAFMAGELVPLYTQSDATVKACVEWLCNNYQDHANIADLCDAMLAAHPATEQADVPTWQERMPEPRAAFQCSMNCSSVGMGNVMEKGCGDCMPIAVHGDPIVARDAEIADLRAALAKRGQP
jgi:hypothetical protein